MLFGLKGALVSVTPPTTTNLKAMLLGSVRRLGLGACWRRWSPACARRGLRPSAVAADACANAAVRAQTGSTGLPDCRAYEMVSPPYKEGFPVMPGPILFTDDGIVSYQSSGAFAGNAMAGHGQPVSRYAFGGGLGDELA